VRRAAALALSLALAACQTPMPGPVRDVPAFRSPELPKLEIRRVALLPFQDDGGARTRRHALEETFARQLELATGIEVIRVDEGVRDEVSPKENPRRLGTYELGSVLELAARYGADGVLYGAITAYRPYVPQELGLRGELVYARSGLVVWTFDAHFDLADAASERALADAHRRLFSQTDGAPSWDSVRTSPDRMAVLVCARAAESYFPRRPDPFLIGLR